MNIKHVKAMRAADRAAKCKALLPIERNKAKAIREFLKASYFLSFAIYTEQSSAISREFRALSESAYMAGESDLSGALQVAGLEL